MPDQVRYDQIWDEAAKLSVVVGPEGSKSSHTSERGVTKVSD